MAATDDDLDFNTFYQALQTQYHTQFTAAQERCSLILVPKQNSFNTASFDLRFIEFHILKPSPYFKGQFNTTDRQSSGTVEVENGTIKTMQGFEEERSAKIISEETGYNSKMKPYKILVIDKPLVGSVFTRSLSSNRLLLNGVDPCEAKFSLQECHEFLLCFDECQKCLTSMKPRVKAFRANYLFLKGYLDDVVDKLREMYDLTTQTYIQTLRPPHCHDIRIIENIKRSMETYLMSLIYDKIWPVVCDETAEDDSRIDEQFRLLTNVKPEVIGVREELCCTMTTAIMEVANLSGLKTPLEKLMCMKQTLDNITESVNAHLLSSHSNSEGDVLTSDDYLPLVVSVLSQSSIEHISANVLIAERFHWSSDTADGLSYSLVTFRAAVAYTLSLDVDELIKSHRRGYKSPTPPNSPHKQINHKPSNAETRLLIANKPTPEVRKVSKLEKQMERISKMTLSAEEEKFQLGTSSPSRPVSTKDWQGMQSGYKNRANRSQERPQLGEFLTGLRSDSLPSYGKQN